MELTRNKAGCCYSPRCWGVSKTRISVRPYRIGKYIFLLSLFFSVVFGLFMRELYCKQCYYTEDGLFYESVSRDTWIMSTWVSFKALSLLHVFFFFFLQCFLGTRTWGREVSFASLSPGLRAAHWPDEQWRTCRRLAYLPSPNRTGSREGKNDCDDDETFEPNEIHDSSASVSSVAIHGGKWRNKCVQKDVVIKV